VMYLIVKLVRYVFDKDKAQTVVVIEVIVYALFPPPRSD
jgi:hypothetical protein